MSQYGFDPRTSRNRRGRTAKVYLGSREAESFAADAALIEGRLDAMAPEASGEEGSE